MSHDSYCAYCDGPCQLLKGVRDPIELWEKFREGERNAKDNPGYLFQWKFTPKS